MSVKLKPLGQQTLVITGATSGIGLATAREAAQQGAKLVIAARNEKDLRQVEEEIGRRGGPVVAVVADVGKRDEVRQIAQAALTRFGSFDTWVNNAGISIWGRLEEVSEEDSRRLFETNFWGVVNGSLEAIARLKLHGGALVNMGSVVSDRAVPLQGMYSASKHAVKGFTDALRMELEHEGAPISVTLIKPTSIDTPFPGHARNYLDEEIKLPPPVYSPQEVAHAILYAAAHPVRDIYVGGAGKMISSLGKYAPRLTDRYMEATMFEQQKRDEAAQHREGTLHRAGDGLSERGNYPGHVMRRSLYTRASLHPWITGAILGAAGVVAGALATSRSRGE